MNSIEQLARYNYSYEGEAIGAAIAIIVIVIFLAIAAILAQIFLGLAVYHDAKSKGNSSSGMWGVLTGVFGWIPAIIYLCVRNKELFNVLPVALQSRQARQDVQIVIMQILLPNSFTVHLWNNLKNELKVS